MSNVSNISSHGPEVFDCTFTTIGSAADVAYLVTKAALLVPLYTFILYLGVQKWKQQRSFTSANHSDILTYHLAAFVVIYGLAVGFFFFRNVHLKFGTFLFHVSCYGENYIQVLSCLEQYLAVVHPVVYRGLRNARGVRIRNISVGCVWLLTLVSSAFIAVYSDPHFPILFLIPFAVCLVVVSFCCLSVLCVLIRPGPGEGGRVDQSKQRAFNTISAILVVQVLWLGAILVCHALYSSLNVSPVVQCVILNAAYWFNLPTCLVLPLLYLHRAGKLSFCCHNNR